MASNGLVELVVYQMSLGGISINSWCDGSLVVGVTGSRKIMDSQEMAVRHSVSAVLAMIVNHVKSLLDERPVWLFSPLAEGADRLVAEEALKLGYAMVSPLPFPQHEYERDFPASVETFRTLLAQAKVIELDGIRASADRSYEAVGEFVVEQSDIVIAIWDGLETGKRGGTGAITKFSCGMGIPIWWLPINPLRKARWMVDLMQWEARAVASCGDFEDPIKAYLEYKISRHQSGI